MTDTQTHYRTCNICEAMCGLEIKHRGNEILSIKGDNNDPFSHGHICPKAVALQDFYNDEDRLKTPMWRTADGWQEISWDEAFREIASRFRAIQQEHGQDAVGVGKRLKAIQQRGGKVVVVDPRRTETAKKADQHLFIRPETDALFMLAMVYTLFEEQLVTLGHLEDRIDGLELLAEAVKPYSPETVADACGMSANAIRELAREMAAAKSAVCYSRMGASTQSFGGLCQWLNNVLNILTGNFDSRGGAMFPQPAFDLVPDKKGKPSSYGRYESRVRKLPYFNNEFPVATLADEILTQGEGQIRAMMTVAGNPVLSAPGGARLEEAFDNLDFMVSVDIYLNETTRHADIILPATTGLEVPHFDVFFNSFAVRNTAKFSEPMFEKAPNQKHDWEILRDLALQLTGLEDDGVTPEAMLDLGLKHGAYGKEGMSLETLKASPHGVDLGPLQRCLEQRIQTEDGRIRIAPELYLDDLERLDASGLLQASQNSDYPFTLISRRLPRSHNTWTQNSHRLVKGKNPCTLQMNASDARKLGLEDGQLAAVSSATGSIELPVEIDDNMFEGVISMPQGWGHNRPDTAMSIAEGQPGVSMNDVTDSRRIDALTGNAAFNGTRVAVRSIL